MMAMDKMKIKKKEVRKANIILCTLSMSGITLLHEVYEQIDYLMIDEAC
jgi:superfamily I DNA and/or RNA helicase